MELFYSNNIDINFCILDERESAHCMKVLRHRCGDRINVIDGCGNLMTCRIKEFKKEAVCEILSIENDYGGHPYGLYMAVAPTKNIDRYEWFLEKGCELGMDVVIPIIGEFSERKVVNIERLNKVLVSAAKQSQKGAVPILTDAIDSMLFFKNYTSIIRNAYHTPIYDNCSSENILKLIAYCGDMEKTSIIEAIAPFLRRFNINNDKNNKNDSSAIDRCSKPEIIVMIGPEGDFSPDEVSAAIKEGFVPVHLGSSRLRTETAAVAAVSALYFQFLQS